MSSRLNQLISNFLGGNPSVGGIDYTSPTIINPDYDLTKKGVQYEELPEGTFIGPDGTIISEDAPTGIGSFSNIKRLIDKVSGNRWDLDKRGSGLDKWGRRIDAPGTLGGLPIEIKPEIANPNYDPTKATNPVPNIGSGLSAGKIIQDAYSGWRDNRLIGREADRNLLYNQMANKYAYDLNKAGMLEAMNTPYWKAKTSLTAQQALAIPRLAKAALIEARAKSQEAANEFGELGLQRTYFSP
tara:strand:+ start:1160 stop:1885 length:726 start_codon:yes stop_codon:yes gene_type:complete